MLPKVLFFLDKYVYASVARVSYILLLGNYKSS